MTARAFAVADIPSTWWDSGQRVVIEDPDGQPLITGRLNVGIGRTLRLDVDTADGMTLPTRFPVPVGATVRRAEG